MGVPQVHHFGQEGLHNVLVIDLLGPSLGDLFDMCGRKFSIKTVCMAAKQMVSARHRIVFSYMHAHVTSVHIMAWDVIALSCYRLSRILADIFVDRLILL